MVLGTNITILEDNFIMINAGIYLFKEEFCKALHISVNQMNRRQDELFAWLNNFFDYEILQGRPIRIHVKAVLADYQPLPRKVPSQDKLTQEKLIDYEKYTMAALGTEFKPNSKMKIARDAIESFGYTKYYHNNPEWVARNFVTQPFNTYGETNNQQVWVYYSTYEPMPSNVLEKWRTILHEEHIGEKEAANAFYKQEQG